MTPDQYSNMWRAANAMLRDNKIDMGKENPCARCATRRRSAGPSRTAFSTSGWSIPPRGSDAAGKRTAAAIIAKSRDQINMPLIASPKLSAAQVVRLRAAILALDPRRADSAILKKINLPAGFKETPRDEPLDFLKWLGDRR